MIKNDQGKKYLGARAWSAADELMIDEVMISCRLQWSADRVEPASLGPGVLCRLPVCPPDRRLDVRGPDLWSVPCLCDSVRGESSLRRLRPSVTPLPLRIRLLRCTMLAYAVFYVLRAGGIVYLGLGPSLPWALSRRTSSTSPGPSLTSH